MLNSDDDIIVDQLLGGDSEHKAIHAQLEKLSLEEESPIQAPKIPVSIEESKESLIDSYLEVVDKMDA